MSRRLAAAALLHASLLVVCTFEGAANPTASTPTLRAVAGTTRAGEPTDRWVAMVSRFRNENAVVPPRADTADEQAWASSIAAKLPLWESEIPALAAVFGSIAPPAIVDVVVGSGGGSDAFTHDPTTIGFDVRELQRAYGAATLPENAERLDRFFRHEYTHILQKAWLAEHPYAADTPIRAALLGIWLEGLGNYYSLSGRWRSGDGAISETARRTLEHLTPRLVARLAALACASPESTETLTAGLSMGAFDRKWGALPVALWLAQDQHVSPDALAAFVRAGPEGVWDLADRSLPGDLSAVLRESRATADLCASRR